MSAVKWDLASLFHEPYTALRTEVQSLTVSLGTPSEQPVLSTCPLDRVPQMSSSCLIALSAITLQGRLQFCQAWKHWRYSKETLRPSLWPPDYRNNEPPGISCWQTDRLALGWSEGEFSTPEGICNLSANPAGV